MNDYDRETRDVLALQHDVAEAIAREIGATLATDGTPSPVPHRVDPAAHDLNLKGHELVYRYNEPSIAQAIGLLEEAIRIDPTFADAWTALAAAHSERGLGGCRLASDGRTRARGDRARAGAWTARVRRPTPCWATSAWCTSWDWTASERAVKRSIDLAPGNMQAHRLPLSAVSGPPPVPEAVAAVVQQRLDPASSLTSSALGRAQYRAGQFDAAIGAFNQAMVLDRTYGPKSCTARGRVSHTGRYDDALHWLDEGQAVAGGTRRQTNSYGLAYALAGQTAAQSGGSAPRSRQSRRNQ